MLERVEDGVEKFPCSGDNNLARAAPGFDAFVEATQAGAVFYRDQRALHPPGAGGFVATLGDTTDTLAVVGLATRRNAEVGGKIARLGKVLDVANSHQQCGCRERPEALDRDQILITRKRFGESDDFRIQHFPALMDGIQLDPRWLLA